MRTPDNPSPPNPRPDRFRERSRGFMLLWATVVATTGCASALGRDSNDGASACGTADNPCRVTGEVTLAQPLSVSLPTNPLSVEIAGQAASLSVVVEGQPPGGSSKITYRGATTTLRQGGAGLAQLNADCNAEFPNTRLCRDVDIINSIPAPVPPTYSWFMVTAQGGLTTTVSNCMPTDSWAAVFSSNSSNQFAFVINDVGNIVAQNCDVPHTAMCCGY